MKKPKPDRFERILRNRVKKLMRPGETIMPRLRDSGMSFSEVLLLLRRQHRAMVRMVRHEFRQWEAVTLDRRNPNGRIVIAHHRAIQCRDIVDILKQYAK